MTSHEEPSVYYSSIEERFLAREGVDLRRSFQSPGLAFHGSIFAFLSAAGLVVKVGVDVAAEAIEQRHALPYRPSPAHVSRDWLLVPFDPSDAHRWAEFVDLAYNHVRTLKPDTVP
ncbi:MAG: hypothetical protein JWQ43_1932 [Glaciihabitans sp.]|nr:hypothetical protein [Glaciihabitans sp.]